MKKLALLLVLVMMFSASAALAEKAVPADAESQVSLGDNLYDFQLVIEGVLYQLPTTLEAFTNEGWVVKDTSEIEQTLEPDQYTFSIKITKNVNFETKEMGISFFNDDNCVKTVAACPVSAVSIDRAYGDKPQVDAALPKDIAFLKSTQAEIEEAYGTPSRIYEGTSYNELTYEMESYRYFRLQVGENGLEDIDVRNFVRAQMQSPVSQDVPDYIKSYVAPTELGDDLHSLVVSFGGALYKLPAPVSAFVENGFVYQGARVESVSAKDSPYGGVQLLYNNQSDTYYTKNYADVAVLPENCAVYRLACENETDPELILPGGIKRGMTRADLESIIASIGFEKEDYSDKYLRYRYSDADRNDFAIYVTKADDLVSSVEIDVR